MDIGMLWYDDDPKRTLDDKIKRAAAFYQEKYNLTAVECYVNPAALKDLGQPYHVGAILGLPRRETMLNHFWLGLGDQYHDYHK